MWELIVASIKKHFRQYSVIQLCHIYVCFYLFNSVRQLANNVCVSRHEYPKIKKITLRPVPKKYRMIWFDCVFFSRLSLPLIFGSRKPLSFLFRICSRNNKPLCVKHFHFFFRWCFFFVVCFEKKKINCWPSVFSMCMRVYVSLFYIYFIVTWFFIYVFFFSLSLLILSMIFVKRIFYFFLLWNFPQLNEINKIHSEILRN